MLSLSRARAFLRNLTRRGAVERDLDEEIAGYVDLLADEKSSQGLPAAAARRTALIETGGVEQVKEHVRDASAGAWIAECGRDIRYAVRMLRSAPGFTLVAVLTLALGIGANTAVFTVVDGVLLRPLAFPDPDRLMLVSFWPATPPSESLRGVRRMRDVHYVDFSSRDRVFEHLATYSTSPRILAGRGDPTHVSATAATTDLFATLGVSPVLGRAFGPDDAAPGQDHVVVLGDALWRQRFGSDVAVVGRMIDLDGMRHEIIGVMPPGFAFPPGTELWTPLAVRLDPHLSWSRVVVGRLKAAYTARDAYAELDTLAPRFPEPPRGLPPWRTDITPLKELIVGHIRSSLYLFVGAVALVLLIACANVANLLLTRATGRRHEMAVRAALGANRARLIRQALTESAVLSLLGGAAGVLLSIWAVRALLSVAPAGTLPRIDAIQVDARALAFTVALSLVTGLAFGVAPALGAGEPDLRQPLSTSSRTLAGGRERLRNGLAIAEVALAVFLMTGAGLLLRSFLRLRAVDSGFQPDRVGTLTVDLPGAQYTSRTRLRQFHSQMLTDIARLPDVTAVAAVNWPPPGPAIVGDFKIEGDSLGRLSGIADKIYVSPGYFHAMGIPILSGRDFSERDDAREPGVVVISQSLARRMWPGQDPVGRRLTLHDNPTPANWVTVIGVVGDIRQRGPEQEADPAIYQTYLQDGDAFVIDHMAFVARSESDPSAILAGMRALLRRADPDIPGRLATLDDTMARTTAAPEFQVRLIGIFAVLALLLAAIGVYGVLAYSVAARTREIGIRIALGARITGVMALVAGRMLLLTGAGIVIGTGGAVLLTRQLTRFLFQVAPHDPATLAGVVVVVMFAAAAAAFVPMLRIRSVDPILALRTE